MKSIKDLQAELDAAKLTLQKAQHALDEAQGDAAGRSIFAPSAFPTLAPVKGVALSAAEANVRYAGRLDVMLAQIAPGAALAGATTKSKTRAAPVLWCEDALAAFDQNAQEASAIIVNAGNANAFTGDNGADGVNKTAQAVGESLGVSPQRVFVCSTGVIGEPLPAERITAKIGELKTDLRADAWERAASAIMTTDTYPKGASAQLTLGGAQVAISGIAKGSGMIAPDMATMLVYIFTDAAVTQPLLREMVAQLCDESFNAITVDGDTSTSDTLLIAATAASGARMIDSPQAEGYDAFKNALRGVMLDLAHQVVKDGEGLTKFVEVRVTGAESDAAAKKIALSIANSPLVKTAWAGEDPNWGRLIMAIGKSGEQADRDKLLINYGPHKVAAKGWRDPSYNEAVLAEYMRQNELQTHIDVGVGAGEAVVWTCDLTHGYISINADYRS